MIYIYKITRRNKVLYVGSSVKPRRRLSAKRNELGQDVQMAIVEEVDEENWGTRERYWIKKLRPTTNKHPGGGGGCTWKPIIDKAFRDRKRTATLNAWKDPKTRRKLLARTRARWDDPEQMKRHIAKHTGSKRSAESRRLMSIARKRYWKRRKSLERSAK